MSGEASTQGGRNKGPHWGLFYEGTIPIQVLRRADLNQGIGEPQSPSRRVFNPYTEFKEFSRKQIKDMEKMFKE